MDPITQATLGAALPTVAARRDQVVSWAWIGALAGMSPDLDVLIFSPHDPLLFLEYHRGFTHSLIFIPAGATLCALVLARWFPRLGWRDVWLAALLGYCTHALLDACTAYGTQLLWPFADTRFAWNNVSIIDPLFTGPLLIAVLISVRSRWRTPALIGIGWAISYLLLGVVQHERALHTARDLAQQRGHQVERLIANPSLANLFLWRTIYLYQGRYYVDAVRTGLPPSVCAGQSITALQPRRDLPWLDPASQQARDLQRFSWFAAGMLAVDPQNPLHVIDLRYAALPDDTAPLWGIRFDPDAPPDAHVQRSTMTAERLKGFDKFAAMLLLGQCRPPTGTVGATTPNLPGSSPISPPAMHGDTLPPMPSPTPQPRVSPPHERP